MADHDIVLPTDVALVEGPTFGLDDTLDSSIFSELESEFILADHEDVATSMPQLDHEALLQADTTPRAQILDRIYFFPTDPDTFEHFLQYGLVTGDEVQQFRIWNAFVDEMKFISAITSVAPSGTEHDVPDVPVPINGMTEKTYNMTVLEIGPPTQDTDYFFTVGSVVFRLDVFAQRLQELDSIFDPNWKNPVKFSYEFYTVIFRNNVFKEQRRPLYNLAVRAQEASFLVNEADFERAHNVLKRSHGELFFVPIFHELLIPTNSLQGSSFINTSEEIEDYYNLMNFADTLLIKSKFDNTLNEYVSIVSFDTVLNRITLASPIVNNYVTSETIVIPVLLGRLAGFKPRYVTDKVLEFSLQFSEPRRGE